MIAAGGYAFTFLGTGSAVLGLIAAIQALRGRWPSGIAVMCAAASAVGFAGASVLMIVALLARDFSVSYVAQVGSRSTPALFTVSSLWAALEGSILLWASLLAVVTVAAARWVTSRPPDRRPGVLAVLHALLAFFGILLLGPGNPWRPVFPVPADGPGPNPLLAQHPLMVIHPPLLYLGFVGLAVPFALTVDALWHRRLDDRWIADASRSTVVAWIPLTLGLTAGAWWSYAVLGWGGYWAWDPVENVALLPWLTATAFLHSAMVGRRTGALLGWNVALVSASFLLTLFATLVTRSGVLQSVHAFTLSAIGPLLAGLVAASLIGTVGLAALRTPAGRTGSIGGIRGAAIMANNLLLVAVAATVMAGTVFPLVVEAVDGSRVSVGAPYFERIVGPIGAVLLGLMAAGPLLPWGRWTDRIAWRLVTPLFGAVVGAVAAAAAGLGAAGVLGTAGASFSLFATLLSVARRSRLRPLSVRRQGGLVAHAGLAVMALAIVLAASGRADAEAQLRPGQVVSVAGHRVEFLSTAAGSSSTGMTVEASLVLDGTAFEPGPRLTVSSLSNQAFATPAVRPGVLGDVYVALLDADPASGTVTVRVSTYPFISWLWVGGVVLALGAALTLAQRGRGSEAVIAAEAAAVRAGG